MPARARAQRKDPNAATTGPAISRRQESGRVRAEARKRSKRPRRSGATRAPRGRSAAVARRVAARLVPLQRLACHRSRPMRTSAACLNALVPVAFCAVITVARRSRPRARQARSPSDSPNAIVSGRSSLRRCGNTPRTVSCIRRPSLWCPHVRRIRARGGSKAPASRRGAKRHGTALVRCLDVLHCLVHQENAAAAGIYLP